LLRNASACDDFARRDHRCNVSRCSSVSSTAATGRPLPATTDSLQIHAELQAQGTSGYVVKAGDTLTSIAAARDTTWREIAARNADAVRNPDLIFPGQRLVG
jgi:nucleoid-associated protein YgaU